VVGMGYVGLSLAVELARAGLTVRGIDLDLERVNRLNDRGRAVRGASILVLGVTYKPDVNDIRESTALEIIEMLARKGARVAYADPFVPQLTLESLKLTAVEPSPRNLAAADCLLILTHHSCFDYAAIAAHAPLAVDTRNAMKAYRGSGRSIFTL
jgi:UDP-N-acetyl-D-glucosamine dehydrogenase